MQGHLFDAQVIGGCRHGVPLIEKCAECSAEVDQGCQAFWHAVNDGEWDAEGYTPADRRAQAKRRAQTANVAGSPEQAA